MTEPIEYLASLLECGSALPLSHDFAHSQSGRALPHSMTLPRPSHLWYVAPAIRRMLTPGPPAIALVFCCLVLSIFAPSLTGSAADMPPTLSRLPRTNLLVFHDRTGAVQPVGSKADWQQRRVEIICGMTQVMGPLPGRDKR
ncbi:MAG: hypothetical protein NT154_13255 [Verrucomicrobia bacterium]|nr:hypothetical protein [Verrucomicrobiota bacterium]